MVLFAVLQGVRCTLLIAAGSTLFGVLSEEVIRKSGRGNHYGRRRVCGICNKNVIGQEHRFREKVGYQDMVQLRGENIDSAVSGERHINKFLYNYWPRQC